jgi:hypothetical protein
MRAGRGRGGLLVDERDEFGDQRCCKRAEEGSAPRERGVSRHSRRCAHQSRRRRGHGRSSGDQSNGGLPGPEAGPRAAQLRAGGARRTGRDPRSPKVKTAPPLARDESTWAALPCQPRRRRRWESTAPGRAAGRAAAHDCGKEDEQKPLLEAQVPAQYRPLVQSAVGRAVSAVSGQLPGAQGPSGGRGPRREGGELGFEAAAGRERHGNAEKEVPEPRRFWA